MAKRKAMSESELASLLDTQIADAVSYEASELATHREKALAYYEGDVSKDIATVEGKSSVVSHDVADTLGWIMPGLMRVFLQGDRVAEFQPVSLEDEQWAKDATEGVNFLFLERCDGYGQLRAACHDGLLLGNGILKHWWDEEECYKTETFKGLSDDAYHDIIRDKDVEVLAHTERTEEAEAPGAGAGYPGSGSEAPGGMGALAGQGAGGPANSGGTPAVGDGVAAGQPSLVAQALRVHDLKIRRLEYAGKLRVAVVPPEEFLIARDATVLDETVSGCGHVRTVTRSELIKQGYDREIVEELPEYAVDSDESGMKAARDSTLAFAGSKDTADKSMQKVRIYEWFPLVDYDGDGVAERRKVVIGDLQGRGEDKERKILENEEWTDDLPFTDIVPDPVPHRWRGRSVFDEAGPIQRIKTVLWRQALDNLYLSNNPQREAITNQIDNPEELVNPTLGGVVWSKTGQSVRDLVVPFVAGEAFQMLDYADSVLERRTGVSRASMSLDPNVLQPKTATQSHNETESARQVQELYARNLAEGGVKRLFKCILKLVIKYQKDPFWIRRLGRPVQVDPRNWNADMDVSVDVGLGSGSKDRTMAFLQGLTAQQGQIITQFGPMNPLVGLEELRATYADIVEVMGLKTPDKYFKPLDKEQLQAWIEQMAQQPSPEMQKAQAQMQIEQMKAQTTGQLEQMKAQAKAQIEAAQAQADMAVKDRESQWQMQLEQVKLQNQKEIELFKAQVQAQVQGQQAERDHDFRRREHDHKLASEGLKARQKEDGGEEIVSSADVQSERIEKMFAQVAQVLEQSTKPKRGRRMPDGSLIVETIN